MTAASQPDAKIAKEMIDHLSLLSKAIDEYFELPSMTMIDPEITVPVTLEPAPAPELRGRL